MARVVLLSGSMCYFVSGQAKDQSSYKSNLPKGSEHALVQLSCCSDNIACPLMLLKSVLSRKHNFPDVRILRFLSRKFFSSLNKLDEHSALLKRLKREIIWKILSTTSMFIVFVGFPFNTRVYFPRVVTISRSCVRGWFGEKKKPRKNSNKPP